MKPSSDHGFRLWTLMEEAPLPIPPIPELLAFVQSAPKWAATSIAPEDRQFPRLDLDWHAQSGFVVQCYEDESAWSDFLVTDLILGLPEVEIELGGQALEKWPRQLFVTLPMATVALEHFLATGKQSTDLKWVRIDAFRRQIVWEGLSGRLAWELAQNVGGR